MYNVAFVSEALVRKEKIQAALRRNIRPMLCCWPIMPIFITHRAVCFAVIHMSRPKAI